MRAGLFITLAAVAALGSPAQAQQASSNTEALREGRGYIATRTFTAEEDRQVLEAFEGLRVADVTDGMDFVGLHNVGLMDPEIHALWKDTAGYRHRFVGIAVTARYVPTQRPTAGAGRSYEDFRAWEGSWYNELSPEPFAALVRPGTAIVIDEAPDADVGSIGSFNILAWHLAGAVGVVTDATARDTDEIATQQVPLYLRRTGRGIRPGRNELESVNRPVVVGGVLVNPGDVIVADGDGVVVVPRDVALDVAAFAHRIIEADKQGRRALYEQSGRALDPSVE